MVATFVSLELPRTELNALLTESAPAADARLLSSPRNWSNALMRFWSCALRAMSRCIGRVCNSVSFWIIDSVSIPVANPAKLIPLKLPPITVFHLLAIPSHLPRIHANPPSLRLSAESSAIWTLKNAGFVADNRGVMLAVLMLGLLWTASARLTEGHTAYRWDSSAQATIRIQAELAVSVARFRLGDIATIETEDSALRERLAQIELGASPLAGQTRIFTKQQLITRLRQHKIDLNTVRVEMPDTVRLTRAAQKLDASQLEQFAREQLKVAVGESAGEWTLENPPAPASVPSGAVEFRLEGTPRVASGSATMEITALVEGQPRAKHLLRFKAPQKVRQIAVRSGESVQVRVRGDGVVLETRGVARATGALDEVIPVYIPDTQKTIRAQIIEPGVVEVKL